MLCLLQEEGQGRAGVALGLLVLAIVVLALVACGACAILLLLGPQIGNIFSRINSGMSGAG